MIERSFGLRLLASQIPFCSWNK